MEDWSFRRPVLVSLACAALLASCAGPSAKSPKAGIEYEEGEARTQARYAYDALRSRTNRVWSIGYRLRRDGLPLCGEDRIYAMGARTKTLGSYPEALHAHARSVGLGAQPMLDVVYAAGPAFKAGMREGDVLLEYDGETDMKDGDKWRKAAEDGELEVRYERSGTEHAASLELEEVCSWQVLYDNSNPAVNAYADGEKTVIFRGMLNFVEDDRELAMVIAHELAHNAQGHRSKRTKNKAVGIFADVMLTVLTQGAYSGSLGQSAGAAVFTEAFESEADYVGLYFLARAGYEVEGPRSSGAEWRSTIPRTSRTTIPGRTHRPRSATWRSTGPSRRSSASRIAARICSRTRRTEPFPAPGSGGRLRSMNSRSAAAGR